MFGLLSLSLSAPLVCVFAFGVAVLVRGLGSGNVEAIIHGGLMTVLAGAATAFCARNVHYWWGVTLRRLVRRTGRVATHALTAASATVPVAVPTLLTPLEHL